jgi:periplasmic protein TonB
MEPNDVLKADVLDILFENRNKSYGAYPLRKFYAQRLYISMGVTLSLVIVVIFLYLHFHTIPLTTRIITITDPSWGTFTPQPKVKQILQPVRPAAPKPPKTIEFKTPVITPDHLVPQPMATVEELGKTAIGLTTTATGGPDNGLPHGNGNQLAGTTAAVDSAVGTEEIMDHPEMMPEFPGGNEALKRFLMKNLRMPDNNLEPGAQVRVVARFVVGIDGRVREIEITQTAEDAYNTEVKRVISKMPDWKPGMQNHRKVAVYFNLPVIFVSND